jgi:uncharacterized RDD family membrane protein YckC
VFQDFQTPSYAGFWIRVLAYLIDFLVMMAVSCPLGILLGIAVAAFAAVAAGGAPQDSDPATFTNGPSNLMSILIGWLYFSLLESSSWQGTVGKKVLGLKVTDLNGNRLGFGRATGRYFGKILSSMICLIGLIMVAFTEKKQGLHDMLAGTLVVKGAAVTSYPEPPPPPNFGYTGGTFNGR